MQQTPREKELKAKLQTMEQEYEAFRNQSNQLQELLQSQKSDIQKLLQKARQENLKRQKEFKKLNKQLQKQLQEKNTAIKELESKISTSGKNQAGINELTARNQSLLQENARLKQRVESGEHQRKACRDSLQLQKSQHQKQKLKNENLQNQIEKLKSSIHELQKLKDSKKASPVKPAQKSANQPRVQQQFRKQAKQQQAQIDRLNKQLQKLRSVESPIKKIVQTSGESQLQSNLRTLKSALKGHQNHKLQDRIFQLQRQNQRLKGMSSRQVKSVLSTVQTLKNQKLELLRYIASIEGRQEHFQQVKQQITTVIQKHQKYAPLQLTFSDHYLLLKTQRHYNIPFLQIRKNQACLYRQLKTGFQKSIGFKKFQFQKIGYEPQEFDQFLTKSLVKSLKEREQSRVFMIFGQKRSMKKHVCARVGEVVVSLFKSMLKSFRVQIVYQTRGEVDRSQRISNQEDQEAQDFLKKVQILTKKIIAKNGGSRKQPKFRYLRLSFRVKQNQRSFLILSSSINVNKRTEDFQFLLRQAFLKHLRQEDQLLLRNNSVKKDLFLCLNPIVQNYELCANTLRFGELSQQSNMGKRLSTKSLVDSIVKEIVPREGHKTQVVIEPASKRQLHLKQIIHSVQIRLEQLIITIKNLINSRSEDLSSSRKDRTIPQFQKILKGIQNVKKRCGSSIKQQERGVQGEQVQNREMSQQQQPFHSQRPETQTLSLGNNQQIL